MARPHHPPAATASFRGRVSLFAGLLFGLACGGATTQPPSISRFEAVPSVIDVGDPAVLKVSYSNGQGQVDPALGPVPSGADLPVEVATTTEYTLSVRGPAGTQISKTTLTVKPGLLVKVEGLPAGVDAAVTVAGPEGFTKTLTRTEALKGLKPGRYTVSATTVQAGGTPRYPLRLSQEVDLSTTGSLVRVTYPAPTLTVNLPGEVPLDFVLIPPGSFMMGAVHPEQTDGWVSYPDPTTALPRHNVTFAKAFYLAKFPVTTRQWKAVAGWTTPDYATKDPDVAVWNRDWFEWHLDFLAPLNKLVSGKEFRLPSEAEWEYALRAGSTTRYFWGNDFGQVDTYAWTADTTSAEGKPWPKVGLKQPNAWGLHDMFTVFQWTEDDSHYDYGGAPSDGSPWIDNPRMIWRTFRGSTWGSYSAEVGYTKMYFDSARRILDVHPSIPAGLRLALSIPE